MIIQKRLHEWPEWLNDQIAMVALVPDEIRDKFNIEFELSYDSLDEYLGALFDFDGQMVAMICHLNSPVKGTGIVVRGDLTDSQKKNLFENFLENIGIQTKEVIWIASRISG